VPCVSCNNKSKPINTTYGTFPANMSMWVEFR
jgi:hypothetical protein